MEFVELDNGAGEVHDILAALLERVKANKECVCGDFPLVGTLSLTFVLKVSILELGAGLKSKSKLIVSFLGLLVLDAGKDGLAIDVLAALTDNGVANLADQDNKASWCVVVGRVGPDHEDHVHDGNEQVRYFGELSAQVSKVSEQVGQGLEILVVLVGL